MLSINIPAFSPRLALIVSFVLFLSPSSSDAFSLEDWLHDPPYQNGTLAEEIQCYSLPYGGIGFTSHVLTYYTILALAVGHSPWAPWRQNQRSKIDIFLTTVSLIVTIIISGLTMARCRSRWQFIAIAAWKLDLSVTLGFLSIHAAAIIPESDYGDGYYYYSFDGYKKNPMIVLRWIILYIPGVAFGMTGLVSLVLQTIRTNHTVLIVTAVFGSITLAVSVVCALFACWRLMGNHGVEGHELQSGLHAGIYSSGVGLVVSLGVLGALGAFYSDWVLAAVAANMTGNPSSDNAGLFWCYFIAKRLPFFFS
ncbi:hypothetical protein F5884DRAFT_837833 [Xylogone sp. PMI_703]|nr:hypothetical protein F5884DRAFT_837833 [Xylogone sp. PMI_703]